MKMDNCKRFLAALFVLFLFVNTLRSNVYEKTMALSTLLAQKADIEDVITVNYLEKNFANEYFYKREFIDVNGIVAKLLNIKSLYSDMGMYITDDKYIVSSSPYTTTDYEFEETVSFNDFLNDNGIKLIYVNEPTKYTDDSFFETEFGIETYSNRNMDLFLNRLRSANVNVIDIRDNIKNEGLEIKDLFYRTDHHWTIPTGLWATKIIADGLNEKCGYSIDTSIYNIENYECSEYKECWLGEQGRKLAETYVGLDDFTEVKPKFETSYTFKDHGIIYQGTFDDFIDESFYNFQNDIYETSSWYYSYATIDCINNNVADGKILILGDSYEHAMMPFLSLGVHEVDFLLARDFDSSFGLRDYIINNGYDTVIVAFAQSVLGAHDDETNVNYTAYEFD